MTVISSRQKAHLIQDDREAIAIAQELAAEFVREDSDRDKERRLPVDEVNKYSLEILRCRQLFPQWCQSSPPSLAVSGIV